MTTKRRVVTAVLISAALGMAGSAFANDPISAHEQEVRDLGMKTLNVKVGAGMEGQTAALSDKLSPGFMWRAAAGVQTLSWFGFEGAYSGAESNIQNNVASGRQVGGADFVRNGLQAAATFNLPIKYVQPYALGGIGVDWANYRGTNGTDFHDDMFERLPVGGGVKAEAGPLTVDARFDYSLLYSQNFVTNAGNRQGGLYDLGLNVGAQF